MSRKVDFWYEFTAPASYFSVMRIDPLAKKMRLDVTWRPFLMGGVARQQNVQPPPPEVQQIRTRYMWLDAARMAQRYGLPFKQPSRFPRPGAVAACVALLGLREGWGKVFSQKVLSANFAEDQEVHEPKVISSLLAKMDLNPEAIMSQALADDNKQALQRETELAGKLGCFGAPTLIVDGEMFWGDDRLEMALEKAAG